MSRSLDAFVEGLSATDNIDRAVLDERAAIEECFERRSMTGRYRVWPRAGVVQPEDSLHRVAYVGLDEECVSVSAGSADEAVSIARVGGAS